MTPEGAVEEAAEGSLRPVYLAVGEEGFFVQQVVQALRKAADTGVGFNEDRFIAQESRIETVLSAVQTAPMMASQRFVQLSGLERWERGHTEGLDALADYAADPAPWTVLVLVADKLHGSRRLVRQAKKEGFLVECAPLGRKALPRWIQRRLEQKGHRIAPPLADSLAELLGPELGPVDDALERLALYVGEGGTVDEDAVARVVTRVRQETVWAIVDALSTRDLGRALGALRDAYETRDALPLLGAVTWRVRQLLKLQGALAAGASPKQAAKEAGVPPFRAGESASVVRRLSSADLEGWLMLLSEADLALKGSRRDGEEVIATMLVDMCR